MNARALAYEGLKVVLLEGRSLSAVLPALIERCPPQERALLQKLLAGVLRWHGSLQALLAPLMKKPLKARDQDVALLLELGAFQLHCMDAIPAHAAVNETIRLLPKKKAWAQGLINGVLRNLARTDAETRTRWLQRDDVARFSHPAWLIQQLRTDWPEQWTEVLDANNQDPPLTLRVNPLRTDRETFMALPEVAARKPVAHPLAPQAVTLTAGGDIRTLPGFDEGWFSVQDAAAQQAAHLLAPQPGERILDACAAPGGKTAHLLELSQNQAHVLALEKEVERLPRLRENLARLQLHAQVRQGDATRPEDWWDGKPFDRILLDAPCSATGIIRRHPDIKWHRTPADVQSLTQVQAAMLGVLWPLLRPGGRLLYATCSVLAAENRMQIEAFLRRTPDAVLLTIEHLPCYGAPGCQLLPGVENMDGFFYALVEKRA